jgi:hypothetical protein
MSMQVAFALFAEYAQLTSDGRLNALGLDLGTLQAKDFPLELPSFFLIVKLVLEPEERKGKYKLTVQMIAPDGMKLGPSLEAEFAAPPPENPGLKAASTMVGNFGGMTFPTPGIYTFPILVNGKELTAIRMSLHQTGPTTPPAQQPPAPVTQ